MPPLTVLDTQTLKRSGPRWNPLDCLNMTKHRQLVLDFIRAYIRLHGVPPSYEVIARGLGLSSKSNVHRIIHRLKEDGHLTIRPYKFHSIRLVDKSVKEMAAL